MNALELVTLAAGDFQLRPPRPEDAEAALAMLADAEVRQWHPGPATLTLGSVRDWLERGRDWSGGSAAVWTVHEADSLVGQAYVFSIDRDQLDASVAYRTAPWARGRGVATAAVLAMTAYAFDVIGLERLRLLHSAANPASCRVAEKAGYDLEGTERGGFRDHDGLRWDSHLHGCLKAGVVSRP